jgi:hypothetical protein
VPRLDQGPPGHLRISVGVDRFSSSPFASAPGSLLRRRARLLVAVTATDIGVFDAHSAAFTRAGTRVPLPRALVCSLPRNVIGRRTGSRGVDETTAGGLTGGSTVGSAGVPLRRVIRLRRAIGWRTIAWRRSAILRVRPRHPGGRCQDPYSRDCNESAFHRLPPLNKCDGLGATDGNAGVMTNVPNMPRKLSLIAAIAAPEAVRFVSQRGPRVWHRKGGLPAPRNPHDWRGFKSSAGKDMNAPEGTLSKIPSLKSVQQPHVRRGRFDQHGCP